MGRAYKLTAGGNDFIVVDALADGEPGAWDGERARLACRRRLSVGADGLIALVPSDDCTARFVLWNRDGSAAAVSGNGARCAARLLHHLGRADGDSVTLATPEGVLKARVGSTAVVALELPTPRDLRLALDLPDESPAPTGDYAVVGVPYLAVPCADPDALELERAAPPLRSWDALPDGANVAFYEPPADPDAAVELRTWERGVEGETLSSGTGAAMVALSVIARSGPDGLHGAHAVELAPRSGLPATVRVVAERGDVRSLELEGDARLIAELRLGPDAFWP